MPDLRFLGRVFVAFLARLGFALIGGLAAAQTIQPIYTFTNSGFSSLRNANGDLILGSNGDFYGTTEYGGSGGFGTVFRFGQSGDLTVLANFSGSTGGNPSGELAFGPDGSIYGTTFFAGPGGNGTVFRVTTNGDLTILYSFSKIVWNGSYYTNADGAKPYAGLTLGPDACFYGATSEGGSGGTGTLFRITTNGLPTTIFSFEALPVGGTNVTGAAPYARLTLGPDGSLYGTTFIGGGKSDGTIFRVRTNGSFTLLATFVGPNGNGPQRGMIVGPDNSLYGTTLNGGIYGDEGTVFKMTTNGVLTTLVSFNFDTGTAPKAGVTFGPDGNLYGTTTASSSLQTGAWGTVFRLTTNGVLTTLANFYATNGSMPEASLTLGSNGNLYGTTWAGGNDTNGAGEIYRVNLTPSISISRGAGGAVVLNLASTLRATNRLWTATNTSLPMGQWDLLTTMVATNGFSQFTDTNTSGIQTRFYRVSTP
jgi:uncharacterized repeat protein (TIGR03803 family)